MILFFLLFASNVLIVNLVMIFLENERLPTSLGWHRKNATVTLNDILNTVTIIRNATDLLTPEKPSDSGKRRDIHSGVFNQLRL